MVLSSRQAAMAKPVNEPVFGARNDEMGIVFAAFKPPAGKFEGVVKARRPPINAG
ncbi:hypothetical protein [Pararhizobium polonicum]|uniref:hypothetical protein n=1 Tax=Pararhizobium polonicum TaxID=1612624 RepID=UPI001314A059|nr:hypothetical protein [Pararhizobium polonicum]